MSEGPYEAKIYFFISYARKNCNYKGLNIIDIVYDGK